MGFSVREYVKEKKHSGGSTSVYSSGRGVPANSSGNQSRKNSGEANNGSVYTVKTFLGTAANGGSTQKAKADTHSAAADTSGLLGFLEDYGSFAKESKNSYLSAANTYKSASDSGKQNAKKQKEVNEYRGKIEGYLADVKSLDKLYGEGASSVVSEHLNSMNAELDAISKAYDLQNSFWQQFESEAEYKNYEERKKEAERLAALDVNKEKRKLTGLKAQLEETKKAKNLAVLGYSARNSVFAADEKYKLQNDSDLQRVNDAISAYKELQNKISAVEADIYNAEKVQKDNLYNSYLGADDFDFYSKLGASVKNPGTTEYLYDHEINNVLDYLQRMEENPHYSANPVGNKYHIYSYLDEDEESIYNYMLGKYGKEEAQEYLDHMREALNYINGEEISERLLSMDDGWGKKLSLAVHSFSSGLENSVTGIGQLLSSERLPTSSLQFSQEKIREGLREEGKNAAVLALDAINSIGNMAPSLLLSVVAGPTAGSVTLGLSASGNAYNQALAEGKNKKDAATYGVLIGASEGVLQRVLGGIGRLGGTAAQKLGISLNNIDNALLRISSKFVLSSLSEGGEEYLQAVLEPMYRNIIFGENNEVKLVSEEAAYSALLGMITSGILEGAPTAVKDANKAYLADVITEAGNYDLLLKNALALEDGSKAKSLAAKLTLGSLKKNNANIGELVAAYSAEGGDVSVLTRRALSEHSQASEGKADVSADGASAAKTEKTAEAPLREKTGKAAEQMLTEPESEKASSENTGALGKYQKYISNAANAVKNTVGDRINSMIAAIKPSVDMEITISGETYQRNKSLSEYEAEIEALEKLPGNRMFVKAKREQAFEADLSKYSEKQRAAVKRAIDSGVLDNTNGSHELVDLVAKLEEDKALCFDFTNNEKLKETGFALEGKAVNGYVTKDGIILNVDSQKALNVVVGHEITHVLEGTEFYSELQKAVKNYAVTKGEYETRYEALTKLYAGVDGANIEAEITADLIGDYLFSDTDFVNRLSAEKPNIFQKIYEEIKYLYKIATAGSKEARELEKVKRAFEEAYRADGKSVGDTKYSLESKTQPGKLDPRTVTKNDVVEMLNCVENGDIYGNTYVPIRISTPTTLIHWASERRGDVIDNNPIAISAEKAYNAMNREGETESGRSNRLSVDDLVSMIESMNDPQYIVYQGANDRYVEVVKFDTESGDTAFAVIEIGNSKDSVYMNGYEGGLYNILVTTYPPRAGKLKELLNNSNNQVIYDKKKDASQRTSGSTVPSVLNDASFYEDTLPQIEKNVKPQFAY